MFVHQSLGSVIVSKRKDEPMNRKPNVFRVMMAADRMLDWIKRNEPDTRYTRAVAVVEFLREHVDFRSNEAEAAIKSLLEKGAVRFGKRSTIESVTA
jgi:hypothetical protein